MEQQVLEKLQSVETEMLAVLHKYCTDHGIDYSLMFGTLIGAVRHHGPIPWDDDVDIIMDRDNYSKFIETFLKEPIPGYYMQTEGPDTKSTINHMKIRKEGTVLASKSESALEEHNGIWIDVFVFDRVPDSKMKKRGVLFWNNIRMIYTRGYVPKKGSKAKKTVIKLMLCLPEKLKKRLRVLGEKKIQKYNNYTGSCTLYCLASPDLAICSFPENCMKSFKLINYCGHRFKVSSDYENILRIKYGDYMQLPPEEERICKHNPSVVIFEKDQND